MNQKMTEYIPWNKHDDDMVIYAGRFLRDRLHPMCYDAVMDLSVEYAYSEEPVEFSEIGKLSFRPIAPGEVWADHNFACAWFHLTGRLPEGTDRKNLLLKFCNDGEGLLVSKTGSAVKGFTTGSPVFGVVDESIEKIYYPLDGLIADDGSIDLYIDGASNGLLGEFVFDAARLRFASVVRENPEILEVYYDYETLYDYVCAVDYENSHKREIIYGLWEIQKLFEYHIPDWYPKAKEIAARMFSLNGDDAVASTTVAHSHLDLLWLWPLRESKRKAKRTFSNLAYHAEKYPQFRFVVPQPQQLEWIKQSDPELYEHLKALEKRGQMEPVGGAWVENDTNLPGEESLSRQMLYGQKFWLEEFGHYTKIGWLPDAFGYTGAYPQILKLSGQDSFMTIKISWSDRTIFPYNTFHWRGIDGTSVMTHMPPEGNYNSLAGPKAMLTARGNIKKTDPQDRMMLVYGVGDGGGGPSDTSVERCLRTQNVPYLPKTRFTSAHDFFDGLKGLDVPTHDGEMYLEKHRATYTSQSNTKNNNRTFEERILSLEKLLSSRGEQGDKAEMDKLWKEAMLYHFHDSLPGSCIRRVYDEMAVAHARMLDTLEQMANRLGATFTPGGKLIRLSGEPVFRLEAVGEGYCLYDGADALIEPKTYADSTVTDAVSSYETSYYKVTFLPDGTLGTICLPNGEVLVENANRLRVFIDLGDAWDFKDDYRDQPEQYMHLQKTVTRDFGEMIEIRQTYTYKESSLVQTIVMHRDDPCIRITHDVDWKNSGYMLRAEFLPKCWSDVVRSDIQYGYIERPTTDRTLHEWAQFEMCCQKWFDISDDVRGFAVLNNAKNGFMAKQGILSLDALRSTDYPCVNGDQTPTRYSYALYPHCGGFDPVRIDRLAQQFAERPLYGTQSAQVPTFDSDAVVVTAFKPAYDTDGFILRAFERTGKAVQAQLTLPEGWKLLHEVNLLEDKLGEASCTVDFHPFQIRSFRLKKEA